MATLDVLKKTLRENVRAKYAQHVHALSEAQYNDGFELLRQGSETTYRDFIIPHLIRLVGSLAMSHGSVAVLEIGPGPSTALASLPSHLRDKIRRYAAFEPNRLYAARLEQSLVSSKASGSVFPHLEARPTIKRGSFMLNTCESNKNGFANDEKFDIVLFCHSLYGLQPKHKFIGQALGLLPHKSNGEMVVVFHRDDASRFDHLACHKPVYYHIARTLVADGDDDLYRFASFIAGCSPNSKESYVSIRHEWLEICRKLGRRDEAFPGQCVFSSPELMVIFTRQADGLRKLAAQVPTTVEDFPVKNREASRQNPAAIVHAKSIEHVQETVRWALENRATLTVVGGGHSGHCLRNDVVAIDMSAFDKIRVTPKRQTVGSPRTDDLPLILVESGCKTGDVIKKTMAAGWTIPLGSRPSVGAGLWLQGGIGHLSRMHGLACDSIVGGLLVSVASGKLLCFGNVPSRYRPKDAEPAEYSEELLWAVQGAGTNFGIVVSVVFEAHEAPRYAVWSWTLPLKDEDQMPAMLNDLQQSYANGLTRRSSTDLYLYYKLGKLNVGVTMIQHGTSGTVQNSIMRAPEVNNVLAREFSCVETDGIGLFDTEMYMRDMHGEEAPHKTSSFKRCIFLKHIGAKDVSWILSQAVENRPSDLCYLHLLQGGGAIDDRRAAVGCRNWDYACVITGVWPRNQDQTGVARAAVQWVYQVAYELLPLSCGAYGADLGPDSRDAALARHAFGTNLRRLVRLKRVFDPQNVLAHACPLREPPTHKPELVVLVTGEDGAGKDYCAKVWESAIIECTERGPGAMKARVVRISDAIKRQYAAVTGADFQLLLDDRAYKEQHRAALTAYWEGQMRFRPNLPQEHFLGIVLDAPDVDVLFVTGIRDEAPVATLGHLVPHSRVIEAMVEASAEVRAGRRGIPNLEDHDEEQHSNNDRDGSALIFHNATTGPAAAVEFCHKHFFPFFNENLQCLTDIISVIPDFPRPGIDFHHVLGISQHQEGLAACMDLLVSKIVTHQLSFDTIVCCESGGFIFASTLAIRRQQPLALIRQAGKLPPPVASVVKAASHISSPGSKHEKIEIGRNVLPTGAKVAVVDDVLASGNTLVAVLELLGEVGVPPEDVVVLVVAEFPVHRGREMLRKKGFGMVRVESLLGFAGS